LLIQIISIIDILFLKPAIEPYLAYCKQHYDTTQISKQKRAYEKLVAQYNERKRLNKDDHRLLKKFQKACERYEEKKRSRARPMLSKFKIPRPITSCPSALKSLLRKCDLMGIENQNDNLNDQQKARAGAVSFSADFVSYYFG
jgi:hypothetical protein